MIEGRIPLKSTLASRVIYTAFGVMLLGGIVSPYSYNLFPVDRVFDAAMIFGGMLLALSLNSRVFLYFACSLIYIVLSFIYAVIYGGVNSLDFLLAYKAFVFIVIVCLYVRKNVFSVDLLAKFFYVVLAFFLVKYAYSVIFKFTARMGDRPGLFVENNFELIFLCLYYYLVKDLIRNKVVGFLLVAVVVLFSGSRSAILAIGVVYAYVFVVNLNRYTLLHIILFAVLAAFGAIVISSRTEGGLEEIDRFKFFIVFLNETASWSFIDYVFGAPRITALSNDSCLQLSFYESLFSFSGNEGVCYSVILHSYWLRAVFDHGFIGVVFLIFFLRCALLQAGYSMRDFWCVFGVLALSGLSVSSFNSTFVALTLVMYAGAYGDRFRVRQDGCRLIHATN